MKKSWLMVTTNHSGILLLFIRYKYTTVIYVLYCFLCPLSLSSFVICFISSVSEQDIADCYENLRNVVPKSEETTDAVSWLSDGIRVFFKNYYVKTYLSNSVHAPWGTSKHEALGRCPVTGWLWQWQKT
jgi:hypothetical protein